MFVYVKCSPPGAPNFWRVKSLKLHFCCSMTFFSVPATDVDQTNLLGDAILKQLSDVASKTLINAIPGETQSFDGGNNSTTKVHISKKSGNTIICPKSDLISNLRFSNDYQNRQEFEVQCVIIEYVNFEIFHQLTL